MGMCSGQGMKTVERIISSCREFGRPIGPQHFLINRQWKEWAAAHPEQAAILKETRTPKAVRRAKKKQEVAAPVKKLSVEELLAEKQKMLSKLKGANTTVVDQAIMQAKFEAHKQKKLADAITPKPLTHKSVGNGL